jgi:hypothetical protein
MATRCPSKRHTDTRRGVAFSFVCETANWLHGTEESYDNRRKNLSTAWRRTFRELCVEPGGGTKCLYGASEPDNESGSEVVISRDQKVEKDSVIPSNLLRQTFKSRSDSVDRSANHFGNVGAPCNSSGMRVPLSIKKLRPHLGTRRHTRTPTYRTFAHTHVSPLTYFLTSLPTLTNLLLGHLRAADHASLTYSVINYSSLSTNALKFNGSESRT